ncbi:hypothetical protein AB0O74_17845 [Streptomyces rubiginosohelvolus]|uniref:hypothetical protein n=1 Tax=Streptomyces rubiginosohelvolus TaxID=67362 RepID=UPI00342EC15B
MSTLVETAASEEITTISLFNAWRVQDDKLLVVAVRRPASKDKSAVYEVKYRDYGTGRKQPSYWEATRRSGGHTTYGRTDGDVNRRATVKATVEFLQWNSVRPQDAVKVTATQKLDLVFEPGEVVAAALSEPFTTSDGLGARVKVSLSDAHAEGRSSEVREVGEVTTQEAEQVDKLLAGYTIKAAGPGIEAMAKIMAEGFAVLKSMKIRPGSSGYVDETPGKLAKLFRKKGQASPHFIYAAMAQDPEYLQYMREAFPEAAPHWRPAAGGHYNDQLTKLLEDGTPHDGVTHEIRWVYAPDGWSALFPAPGY